MRKFVVNAAHVSSEMFGEEAVVVNFMTGKYFGLTGSAPAIWQLFATPVTREEVLASFGELNGLKAEIREQVSACMDILLQESLIVDAGVADGEMRQSGPATVHSDGFRAPVIEIYEDLKELIVLDPIHDTDPERGWPVQQNFPKPE